MFLQHGMIQLNMDGSHGIFQGQKTRKLAIGAGWEVAIWASKSYKASHACQGGYLEDYNKLNDN
jgi:hypothetical protein